MSPTLSTSKGERRRTLSEAITWLVRAKADRQTARQTARQHTCTRATWVTTRNRVSANQFRGCPRGGETHCTGKSACSQRSRGVQTALMGVRSPGQHAACCRCCSCASACSEPATRLTRPHADTAGTRFAQVSSEHDSLQTPQWQTQDIPAHACPKGGRRHPRGCG